MHFVFTSFSFIFSDWHKFSRFQLNLVVKIESKEDNIVNSPNSVWPSGGENGKTHWLYHRTEYVLTCPFVPVNLTILIHSLRSLSVADNNSIRISFIFFSPSRFGSTHKKKQSKWLILVLFSINSTTNMWIIHRKNWNWSMLICCTLCLPASYNSSTAVWLEHSRSIHFCPGSFRQWAVSFSEVRRKLSAISNA